MVFWKQFHNECPSRYSGCWVKKLYLWDYCHISRANELKTPTGFPHGFRRKLAIFKNILISMQCMNLSIWNTDTNIFYFTASKIKHLIMASSNGSIFRVTGPLCGEFTGHRWIPLPKASDAELWCFLWSTPKQRAALTLETPVIWDAIALIMTAL